MNNKQDDVIDYDDYDIRTDAMDEKATACRVLSVFVDDLHSYLSPYLSDIIHTLLPLLNSSPFQDIQFAALAMMPVILTTIADSITDVNGIATYRQNFLFIIDLFLFTYFYSFSIQSPKQSRFLSNGFLRFSLY